MALDDRLVFIIGAPRSGTTLLARLLHATPGAWAPPEPHLLPGLVHSGVLRRVERAAYDPVRGGRAVGRFVRGLPGGREAYLRGLRDLCEGLYARALEAAPAGTTHFVDKTPANALVIRELVEIFPQARFVLLTRHPAAIFHSYATSFFDGDFAAAARFNPVLQRYLPELAWLAVQTAPTPHVLSFEDLVTQPAGELRRLCDALGLPYDAGALDYQRAPWPAGAEGDPVGAPGFARPEPSRAWAWVPRMAGDEKALAVVGRQLGGLADEDLAILGWPRQQLWAPLRAARPGRQPRRRWDRYSTQRRLLLVVRRLLSNPRVAPLRGRARDLLTVLGRPGLGGPDPGHRRDETS
jgi:hypothetical protein